MKSLSPPNENDEDDAGFVVSDDRTVGAVLELRLDAGSLAIDGTGLQLCRLFDNRQQVQELIDELQTLAQQLPPQ